MAHNRIFFTIAGGHVHTEWYSGATATMQHGKNGDMTFTLREWTELRKVFEKFPDTFDLLEGQK